MLLLGRIAVYLVLRCSLLLQTEKRGLSDGLSRPAKTAEPIEMPFGLWTRVGPRIHVLDGGSDAVMGRAILRGKCRPTVKFMEYGPCAAAAAMRPFVKLLLPLVLVYKRSLRKLSNTILRLT